MLSSTSPFRFAGSGETSTASTSKRKRQPEDTESGQISEKPEVSSEKPEISLSRLRRQIRQLPVEIKNLCIPQRALGEDILELSRTSARTDKTALKILNSKFNLLVQHSLDSYGENDRLLQQSLIQANYPVFERLLKALDKPNLAPVIEIAALKNDRAAFDKILEKTVRTKSEVPESTLRFVAHCGQVDLLRKLFATSILPENLSAAQRKALWKTAIEGRNLIDEMRGLSQADLQELFNNVVLSNEESIVELSEAERGPAAMTLICSGLGLGPDAKIPALSRGIELNCTDLVKSLVYINGDLTPLNKQTLLEQTMTDQASPEIFRVLIGAGADVNAKYNDWGLTLLHQASHMGQSEFGKILIEAGADMNAKDIWGRTPLHQAACTGESEFGKMLIEAGANVTAKDNNGNTPLHEAASKNGPEFGKMLIEACSDVNAKDNNGGTPLHQAAYNGRSEFGKMLIEKNADINAKDKNGNTPLDKALDRGHREFADMLRMAAT